MITFKKGAYNPKKCKKYPLTTLALRDRRVLYRVRNTKPLYILQVTPEIGIIVCR